MSEAEPTTTPTEPTPEPDIPLEEPATEPTPGAEPTPEEQEGDEQETAPAEPEPEAATPEAKAQQAEMEKNIRAAEKAGKTFENRLRTIYGDAEADLFPCPLCPEMHKGLVNVHDAGRVPEEIKKAVMMFLGFARETDYPQSPSHRACPTCGALGKVKTGSSVPGQETIGCADCNGRGYLGPKVSAANGQVEGAPILTGPLHTPDAPSNDEVDEWQEPRILPDGRENPNFGKMPHRKIQVEPWGTTAGLTAQDAVMVE